MLVTTELNQKIILDKFLSKLPDKNISGMSNLWLYSNILSKLIEELALTNNFLKENDFFVSANNQISLRVLFDSPNHKLISIIEFTVVSCECRNMKTPVISIRFKFRNLHKAALFIIDNAEVIFNFLDNISLKIQKNHNHYSTRFFPKVLKLLCTYTYDTCALLTLEIKPRKNTKYFGE